MRRLFIMRKDLNMSTGKLLAQTMHCAEAYWTNMLRQNNSSTLNINPIVQDDAVEAVVTIPQNVYAEYINGSFVKTVCEAKSKKHLLKARDAALNIGLLEGIDFGLIYDKCLTELEPEEDDGTTLTGIWFCPLPDDIAHKISKKYHLYT